MTLNHKVEGSNPSGATMKNEKRKLPPEAAKQLPGLETAQRIVDWMFSALPEDPSDIEGDEFLEGYAAALCEISDNIEEELKFKTYCLDCGIDTIESNEYYMVNKDLWSQVTTEESGEGMLCIGCLEERLGRRLSRKDFIDVPVNEISGTSRKSKRLTERLLTLDT